ncbi:MAG: DUF2974 domain-containing protein [Propionibacteriaceae bacterium]|nr:DUF2974 domain-containing protein [Propionibacteriaceae bacterium]
MPDVFAPRSLAEVAASPMGWPVPPAASPDEVRLREFLGYADLMLCVYLGTDPAPPYWQIDEAADARTGFRAGVYRGPQGQIVVSFGGTDMASRADWGVAVRGVTAVTSQDVQAVELARRAVDDYAQASVVFTGHSLGGRLAAEASLATGRAAVTLNAAGLPRAATHFAGDAQDPRARARVLAYELSTDPLTKAQRRPWLPSAFGTRVRLPGAKGTSMAVAHSIQAAQAAAQALLDRREFSIYAGLDVTAG